MAENKVRLKAVGDITLVTTCKSSPFEKVAKVLGDKEVLFGNLETVLSNRSARVEKSIVLHANPEKAQYLKDAGFDILNLANNHTMDLGVEGLDETIEALQTSEIGFVGASNHAHPEGHAVMEIKGIRLAFLGYDAMGFRDQEKDHEIRRISESEIVNDIRRFARHSDITTVSLHWGFESVFYPSPEQIRLARRLVDAGAHIVLGHGPRVAQGIERYRRGLIAYSLGNFQFDFDHEIVATNRVGQAVILSLDVTKSGVESHDVIPVGIDDEYVPYPMDGQEQEEYLRFLTEISRAVTDGRVTEAWWFEQIASTYLLTNTYSWRTRIKRYGLRHAFQCMRWLVSPFVLRCYAALLTKALRRSQ